MTDSPSKKTGRDKCDGNLATLLAAGKFTVTAELGPPKGNRPKVIKKKVKLLSGCVDAVNITDNQTAVVRMSSIAASHLAEREGLEPVMQMVCRDRNRIAIQSDIIGAAALGIKNVLCLSGDHQSLGNQPQSKGVFDVDSMQMISMIKNLRDENKVWGEKKAIKGEINMFIGAAANPFAEPLDFRPLRLKKKVESGVDFIQTQCIFDMVLFKKWMSRIGDMGLDKKCHILAGVTPFKSAKMARYMADHVAGVEVPDAFVARMRKTPEERQSEEGIKICCEQIEKLRELDGIAGIHIMAIGWEKAVPQIVERAGLLPRPVPK